MKILASLLLLLATSTSALAEGRPVQACTMVVIDALEGFPMTGEPRRYDGQLLRFILGAENGDNFDVASATPEGDLLIDFLVEVFCNGLDPLAPPAPPPPPAPTPAPPPPPVAPSPRCLWCGGDPGIYIR